MDDFPPLEDLNGFALALHTRCHELPLRAFQTELCEKLARIVPFDSALIAVGTVTDGVPIAHDAFLFRQGQELMESWETVKTQDVVSFITTSNPGRTHAFVASETYPPDSSALRHCQRFGILQLLSTAAVDEVAGSFVVLSLYRAAETPRFSEPQRAAIELLVPHLVVSMRQSRIDELRRATHVHLSHAPAAAIINRKGMVLEAEPKFFDLLVQSHRDYRGPGLPEALAPFAQVTTHERRVVGRLMVRADPAGDVVLLHARAALPVDTLTWREREVATHVASGLSTKEIGEQLGIANNTVRVHVSRVYTKLGVVNKAELASMLAGVD